MPKSSSTFVTALTASAVAVVGFLAYQASANVPDSLGKAPPPHAGGKPSGTQAPPRKKEPTKPPSGSGVGGRVVYSLGADRVWLVDDGGHLVSTFEVTPSTVDPDVGEFTVTSRSAATPGSDGVQIEHVVRFAVVDGVTIGFSAAVDGSTPKPDPAQRTGGIRESRKDGTTMWNFAKVGEKVVVVP
ncbi:hypothetical protein [Streptomyces sp. NPDC050560]|uniref:hypothetical protein n=1 Tax=Streptomyces sp. NPDC050560 TaxID=3365630 RepID=UPI0037B0F9C4